MDNNEETLAYLVRQYLNNEITSTEYQRLWELLHSSEDDDVIINALEQISDIPQKDTPVISSESWQQKMQEALHKQQAASSTPKNSYKRILGWSVAAAITALISIFAMQFISPLETAKTTLRPSPITATDSLSPGGNKAKLTLANGTSIVLDSSSQGIISLQGNAQIVAHSKGLIAYNKLSGHSQKMVYNKISTPKGGQYQIILSDGTQVWLNSASSIRFPTSFSGKNREVTVTGEVYFDVSTNAKKPFKVAVNGIKVNVLGTRFNINAYDSTTIKTTLLSGAVSIEHGNSHYKLKPGQQAQVRINGNTSIANDINLKQIIAWKNNLFWFSHNTIKEVMEQISRWYDAQIIIRGAIPQHFTGSIPRSASIIRVLNLLQATGNISFQVSGHKIIVSPKP